jgi:RND family efflux transporter MFP subunit
MTKLHIAVTNKKKANISFPIQLIGTVLLISLTNTACTEKPKPAASAKVLPSGVPVKLMKIESAKIQDINQYQGQLQAVQRVSLAPQTNGRIQKIYVTQGQSVSTGAPIMQLSPERSQADVQGAQAQVQAQQSNLANARAQVQAQQSNLANAQARVSSAQADVARQQAQIQAAQAEIKAREGDLRLAQVNYDRAQSLVNQGALPRQELDQRAAQLNNARAAVNVANQQLTAAQKALVSAQANVTSAQAGISQAEANIKSAQAAVSQAQAGVSQAEASVKGATTSLSYNNVVAPINGVVGSIPVQVGDFVNTGQQLTTIIQNDAFDLQIPVSVQRTPQLKMGLPVQIINPQTNQPAVTGSINFISPQIDQNSQTILTKARFANIRNFLRDQLTVTARIVWSEGTGILIPTESITRIGNQPFVFVAEQTKDQQGQPQMTVNQRPVQLGPTQGSSFQVTGGLKEGESIAVSNILRLRNGVPITPEP